ncbi:MAG: serine/threonine protein kinase [Verrucomicrobia bacterium]|nr:serine/threonine protein kinase [Verrucomicrobiota bacterium]
MESSPSDLFDHASAIAAEKGYALHTYCGAGAFKQTFHASSEVYGEIALKLFDKANTSQARAAREIDTIKVFRSSYVAKFFEFFEHVHAGATRYVIVEEFLGGGTLEKELSMENPCRERIRRILICLAHALDEMQAQHLVHRDIKPANIMFRKPGGDPVLVDFGIARHLGKTSLTHSWVPQGPCTPYYASPEQLNNDKLLIDWRSDQFSLGVVAFESLFGAHPYQSRSMSPGDAIDAVAARSTPSSEMTRQAEEAGFGALTKMVQPWPVQRFSTPRQLIQSV